MARTVEIKEIEGLRSLTTRKIPKKYEVITRGNDGKKIYSEFQPSKIKAKRTKDYLLKRFKRQGL